MKFQIKKNMLLKLSNKFKMIKIVKEKIEKKIKNNKFKK